MPTNADQAALGTRSVPDGARSHQPLFGHQPPAARYRGRLSADPRVFGGILSQPLGACNQARRSITSACRDSRGTTFAKDRRTSPSRLAGCRSSVSPTLVVWPHSIIAIECPRILNYNHLIRLESVAQHADSLDLDLGHVAGLQIDRRLTPHADATGRAGENQIARIQCAKLRDVAHEVLDRED